MSTPRRLTPRELRGLFLFEQLDERQLERLAERGRTDRVDGGTAVCTEGEPATCFYVLLSGTITLHRRSHGDDVEVIRTDQRGVYAGAFQAYLGDRVEQVYLHTLRAVTDTEFFVLPAEEFAAAMREWFPMAIHMLEGMFFGNRAQNVILNERERLLALGALSAGLTHELNNPAAAAVRAASALRERVAAMRHKLALVADGRLDGPGLQALVESQDAAVKRAASAPRRSPLETADAEDALGDWLEEHGVDDAWDLAPALVAGDIDAPWLEPLAARMGPEHFEAAVRWLTYTIDSELLMGEIEDSVTRVSELVGAAKQYSQLDRAPQQAVDVRTLLDATLTMLRAKIPPGVRVVKEYAPDLPEVQAYGAELNQVWTNLIHNAFDAMGEGGTLTLRAAREDERVVVEVADTGPGIPEDVRPRIFEPFFTTKPVGEGTGLGLDISYRIVVRRHHGDIRVDSRPGDTRFRVSLPLSPPDGGGDGTGGDGAGDAAFRE